MTSDLELNSFVPEVKVWSIFWTSFLNISQNTSTTTSLYGIDCIYFWCQGEEQLFPLSMCPITTSLIGGAHCYPGNVDHNHENHGHYDQIIQCFIKFTSEHQWFHFLTVNREVSPHFRASNNLFEETSEWNWQKPSLVFPMSLVIPWRRRGLLWRATRGCSSYFGFTCCHVVHQYIQSTL